MIINVINTNTKLFSDVKSDVFPVISSIANTFLSATVLYKEYGIRYNNTMVDNKLTKNNLFKLNNMNLLKFIIYFTSFQKLLLQVCLPFRYI